MSNFPAVATVLGVSQQVAKSGPLLATIGIDPSLMATPPAAPPPPEPAEPVDIKVGDPVTQAVVDNIIGKLPTKKEPVVLKCDVCNITVSSKEILDSHIAGQKHARKVKGQELINKINTSSESSFISTKVQNGDVGNLREFLCKLCNIKVNSHQQLEQHLTGAKHKNKAETNKSNTMPMAGPNINIEGVVNVDIGPNRLFCAACNIHVNSEQQLQQHISSTKHANKVNGRSRPSAAASHGSPYFRQPPRGGPARGGGMARGSPIGRGGGFGRGGAVVNDCGNDQWSDGYQHKKKMVNINDKYNFDNVGWLPNGQGSAGNWPRPRHGPPPDKSFLPGGTLFARR